MKDVFDRKTLLSMDVSLKSGNFYGFQGTGKTSIHNMEQHFGLFSDMDEELKLKANMQMLKDKYSQDGTIANDL